jgi:hypothetical protein
MGILRACNEFANDDALLLLGLVKKPIFSLLNTTIYLMPIFGGRLGSRADELQHLLQAADNGHDEVAYIFYILMVEYNNSMVEVKEALVHVDKFITSSLADQTIRKWICSCDDVLMLLRYEDLGWGR